MSVFSRFVSPGGAGGEYSHGQLVAHPHGNKKRAGWNDSRYKFFLLIIFGIIIFNTTLSSGKNLSIRGVQIDLDHGNRICVSFEGKITSIIVNGGVNLPGNSFKSITKVGETKISRNNSGSLTRIGRLRIHRDWRGNIVKIGNARILRDKHGTITAVNGDPNVSPLFTITPP